MAAPKFNEFCLDTAQLLAPSLTNGQLLSQPTQHGMVDALLSPENTENMAIDEALTNRPGKTPKAYFSWTPPACPTDEECEEICDATPTSLDDSEVEVTINECIQSPTYEVTFEELKRLCEGKDERMARLMREQLRVATIELDKELISAFPAGAGGLVDGACATGTPFTLLRAHTGQDTSVSTDGMIALQQAIEDSGYEGAPIIVANGSFELAMKLQGIACCNSMVGLNAAELGAWRFYKDRYVSSELAGPSLVSPFLVWAPGMAQLLTRNNNVGDGRIIDSDLIHDTFVDPRTGIVWDFSLQRTDCGRKWKFHFKLPYALWQAPKTLFRDCSEFECVNWNWVFQALTAAAA